MTVQAKGQSRLSFRIDFDGGHAIGPGKVQLLESIEQAGSISAAARRMGLSYRKAWLLIDDLNQTFAEPLVRASVGGDRGGGAKLTPTGQTVMRLFRQIEGGAMDHFRAEIDQLERMCAISPRPATAPKGLLPKRKARA